MMKLFVFGIGGTGSRVVEALTYLLASGVSLSDSGGQAVKLIPILLDTDAGNKDTLDCVGALELYRTLSAHRDSRSRDGFFSTGIEPLVLQEHQAQGVKSSTFRLNYQGVENETFRKFIEFDKIANLQTKCMIEALYSEDNLKNVLTGGFLGNPNVGAVVLSGFKRSAEFSLFTTRFSPGDRIFIVSSIFGGTGAAGLPWLVKSLRSADIGVGAAGAFRNAAIGALNVLPYFKLQEDPKSRIDSSMFVTKTKAALSYYSRHVRGVNAVYYISDTAQAVYPNHESGEKQKNDAHFVELLGALSILKFAKLPNESCLPPAESYCEFAIEKESETLDFASFGRGTSQMFARQLTQLQMLAILDRRHFRDASHQPWAKDNGFGSEFFNSSDYADGLSKFLVHYYSAWISELAKNCRSFAPFQLTPDTQNLSTLRNDEKASRDWLGRVLSAETFDRKANEAHTIDYGAAGSVGRFLKLWWDVTSEISKSSYKDFTTARYGN
jgi:hypothetical protein